MICKGQGGSLELLEDRLIIRRTKVLGLLFHGLAGEKTIRFSEIVAVQFKRAGLFLGYIQFTIAGGNESRKGLIDAAYDENSLQFGYTQNDLFQQARTLIESRIGSAVAGPAAPRSAVHELEKLANLLDRGTLTKAEFEQQKSEILKGRSPASPDEQGTGTAIETKDKAAVEDEAKSPARDADTMIARYVRQQTAASTKSGQTSFGKRR